MKALAQQTSLIDRRRPLHASLQQVRRLQAAGQSEQAQHVLRQLLEQEPDNHEALFRLAAIAYEGKFYESALELLDRALAADARHADYQALKGRVLRVQGNLDQAVACFRQALALKPDTPKVLVSLGIALRRLGRLQEAAEALRKAIRSQPRLVEAHINLGNVYQQLGLLDEAQERYQDALKHAPNSVDAHSNLGRALLSKGEIDNAIRSCEKALALQPDHAEALLNLGLAFRRNGDADRAVAALEKAAGAHPDYLDAWLALGETLLDRGEHTRALPCFEHALAVNEETPGALVGVSVAHLAEGRLSLATEQLERALSLVPDFVEAHVNLAGARLMEARIDEAVAGFKRAIELRPLMREAWANYVFSLCYHEHYTAAGVREEHERLGGMLSQLAQPKLVHAPADDAERKLRVGFVSADLKAHSVAFFIEPLLANLDRTQFELFAYVNSHVFDVYSERLKQYFDGWHVLKGVEAQRAASRIHADRIDVLIDLSGYTAGESVLVFAHRPAPVQIGYLGYPTTIGLPEMDYRISDWQVDPPGSEEASSEKLLRLPASYFCYRPPAEAPAVAHAPVLDNGYVTFGSFNNLPKLSERTTRSWARILECVPGSRLLLKSRQLVDAKVRRRFLDRFERTGIDSSRVELLPWKPTVSDHLRIYDRIDIALDCIPYNGATTTCEALWMGVPVVSVGGCTHAGRMGVSILHAAGLGMLIAADDAQFVELAVRLAGDAMELQHLRARIRPMLESSALRDEQAFGRDFGALLRQAWCARCEP